jgi:hypothetical protein
MDCRDSIRGASASERLRVLVGPATTSCPLLGIADRKIAHSAEICGRDAGRLLASAKLMKHITMRRCITAGGRQPNVNWTRQSADAAQDDGIDQAFFTAVM